METGAKFKHKTMAIEMVVSGAPREDNLIELHASENGGWWSWLGDSDALTANFDEVTA